MSNSSGRLNHARRGRGGGPWRGGSAAPKGTFVEGVWHCDCSPPLPAVHFEVKKEGPNRGKWFRTCQKSQEERCKFFLWDADAHPREAAALATNSRTEPRNGNITTPRGQRATSPPPPYTPEPALSRESRKRHREIIQREEDEFDLGERNDGFQEELDQVMAAAETPSKMPRTDAFVTPSRPARRRLPWQADDGPPDNALQTPQTGSRSLNEVFSARLGTPAKAMPTPSNLGSSEDLETMTPRSSPYETPTRARLKNVHETDLVRDTFSVLQDANVQLSESTRKDLTTLLSKHATITEGIRKGRDVARASMTAKAAKITELTYRVSTLEAELEAEKAKNSHLQWSLEHGHQSD